MSLMSPPAAGARIAGRSPSASGSGAHAFELMQYFRSGDTLLFTFLFPLAMLGLFSVAFGSDGDIQSTRICRRSPSRSSTCRGMLAAGLLLSGFQNLAMDIAVERSEGMLKRLGGTPLSPVSYFLGKIGQVASPVCCRRRCCSCSPRSCSAPLPTEPAEWATFAWVFMLGITTSALLGVALSSVPRTSRSAAAVVVPIALVAAVHLGRLPLLLQLPEWLQNVAVSSGQVDGAGDAVGVPARRVRALEQDGEWNLAGVAIALTIWLVVGLVLSRLTFRWIRRDA